MKSRRMLAILVLVLGLVGGASAQLPLGWRNGDVGAPWPPGSASYNESAGVWTVTGDGLDIWEKSDDFHYAYKRLRGDGRITARVVSITGPSLHEWAKAGVMIREDLTRESKHAMMVMTPGSAQNHAASLQWRLSTGGVSYSDHGGTMGLPYWVRIERSGDKLKGYISPNGSSWTQQGTTQTISMTENVYIGLAVLSHQHGVLCTAKFDSIMVQGETAMSTAFTYQGRLLDGAAVADGIYDFQFKMFDDPDVAIGGQLGSTASIGNVDVIDGYFTVELDFGLEVFDGSDRWLEIGVRPGASTGAYTVLEPRQELTPAPYAVYAERAGEAIGGGGGTDNDWRVSGSNMYSIPSGNVGVGTSSPAAKLDVRGNISTGVDGSGGQLILAAIDGTNEGGEIFWRGAGSYDYWMQDIYQNHMRFFTRSANNNQVRIYNSQQGQAGLYVEGDVGIGTTSPEARLDICGVSDGDVGEVTVRRGSRDDYIKIEGPSGSPYTSDIIVTDTGSSGEISVISIAMQSGGAFTKGNVGIGTTAPTTKLDVNGQVRIRGGSPGAGRVLTSDAAGLATWQTPTGGGGPDSDWAVSGSDMYAMPSGNVGIGTSSPGSKLEVTGSSSRAIVQGTNTGGGVGVQGESPSNHGVVGKSTMDDGVHGESANGYGVYGANTSNGNSGHVGGPSYGVYGEGDEAGVYGKSTAYQRYGVYGVNDGENQLGVGVHGVGDEAGVEGHGRLHGVIGYSSSSYGTGVKGHSTDGEGVWGSAADGDGVVGLTANGNAIVGWVHGSGRAGQFHGPVHINGNNDAALTIDNAEPVLVVNGDEAIWHDGTYFSWGFGGRWNFFSDAICVGGPPADPAPSYRLYVNGAAYATGGWSPSDIQFKKNIQTIDSPVDKITNIRGVSFEWRISEYKDKGFSEGRHYGVIAQEVEQVLPEVVKEGPDSDKAVSYMELVPILVEAVKEQQKQIEHQQMQLEYLLERIEVLESNRNQVEFASAKEVQQ